MEHTTVGLLVSALCVLGLLFLFRLEARRGTRFAEHVRARADMYVLRAGARTAHIVGLFGRDSIRQTVHYVFHTFLRMTIRGVRLCENFLKRLMQVNKTLAKTAVRDTSVRTKLDEIALHKAAVALTEEEKQFVKEQSLRGE